jgi:hypothetical protein
MTSIYLSIEGDQSSSHLVSKSEELSNNEIYHELSQLDQTGDLTAWIGCAACQARIQSGINNLSHLGVSQFNSEVRVNCPVLAKRSIWKVQTPGNPRCSNGTVVQWNITAPSEV